MTKILLASSIAFAIPVMALAQDTHPDNPFTVRAGFSYLTDSTARSVTSDFGWTIGGSYDFLKGKSNERYSIDVDYGEHRANGFDIVTWSFQLAVRVPFTGGAATMDNSNVSFYYGAGIGLFEHHFSGTSASSGNFSRDKGVLGGTLLLGAKFSQNASLELFYRISDDIGPNVNTVGLELGWRF